MSNGGVRAHTRGVQICPKGPNGSKSRPPPSLFFLLSGFFLTILLGAIERSGRLLAVAGACLAAVVCIIIFLTPVKLPSWHTLRNSAPRDAATTTSTVEDTSPGPATGTTEAFLPNGTAVSFSLTTELSSAGTR